MSADTQYTDSIDDAHWYHGCCDMYSVHKHPTTYFRRTTDRPKELTVKHLQQGATSTHYTQVKAPTTFQWGEMRRGYCDHTGKPKHVLTFRLKYQ